MQNVIIRYVEDLKARIEPTGCAIQTALLVQLPAYSDASLAKLREAAADLDRIVALEQQRRLEEALTVHCAAGCGGTAEFQNPTLAEIARRRSWRCADCQVKAQQEEAGL